MDYFNLFNKIKINGVELVDISDLILRTNIKASSLIDYTMEDGETVFDIANKVYNDDKLFWVVLLTNKDLLYDIIYEYDKLAKISDELYNRTCYVIEDFDWSYLDIKNITIYHKTDDGFEPIKEYLPEYNIFTCNTNKTGKLIFKHNITDEEYTINQTEYNMKDCPRYYVLDNGLHVNKKPEEYDHFITFNDYLFLENDNKKVIKIIKPEEAQQVISNMISKRVTT